MTSGRGVLASPLTPDFWTVGRTTGETAPAHWADWLRALFPSSVSKPFAARHEALWAWAWAIRQGIKPRPFIGVWPRGGGKSTTAELVTAAVGLRGHRLYVLYVRGTQARANDSVANIATHLERESVARYYPSHADRAVGKFGNAKGWRRERLATAGGFTVDAIGLDTLARGAKIDDARPDLIILDDIDEKHDSPQTTAKKIATITTSILPAGSSDCAVLAIQNLIIPDGFFTRLVDGRADYLAERIVSGPFPAVEGLETETLADPETGTKKHLIVGGTATWAGQDLRTCQAQIHEWGLSAFRKEAQHEVMDRSDSLALRFDERHVEDLTDDEARALVAMGKPFAGIDFGAWRFGFVLRAVDRGGVVHQIAEYFSQRAGLDERAQAIAAICDHYGCPKTLRIRGDAANPQDILEINAAFRRLKAPYHVVAVLNQHKARAASVEKLNDLLDRDAIRYRRDVVQAVATILSRAFERPAVEFTEWRLNYNASSDGTPMGGSRLRWELQHWGYPVPKEGDSQKQDPDDDTADGADLIAADRYGVMSFLKPAAQEEDTADFSAFSPEALTAEVQRTRVLGERKKGRVIVPGGRFLDSAYGEL